MRRNRKSRIRKERMVMIASSALVMGALTLTGIYMKDRSDDNINDGYTIDFAELENSVDEKMQEIIQNQKEELVDLAENPVSDDALDYAPMEAGSNVVEIPGLTDRDSDQEEQEQQKEDKKKEERKKDEKTAGQTDVTKDEEKKEVSGEEEDVETATEAVSRVLNFTEDQGLVRPVQGEILMYYSMDKSIYFATLDQYKYNPAVVISAAEGDQVIICADAKVLSVSEDAEIGRNVVLDLGNGYHAVYGQLKDVRVAEGSYVNRGELLGSVASPTKYYSLEGPNLYFQLKKDGTPVNPEGLFQ